MPVDGILRVPYNIPGSQSWQWVNIFTRLSQERIIFLNQPLTDGLANSIVSAMLYLESEDNTKPIRLYINSLGDPVEAGMASITAGSVSITSAMAIYDTIQHIKSPVMTICLGQAVPHSTIVLDHPRIGGQGQATDLQITAKEVLSKRALMLDILSETTGQPVDKIARDTNRTLYLTPQQAKEYGLIDRVLESSKSLPDSVAALT
jgi:ATP-dependent Clp protease, protease subunit